MTMLWSNRLKIKEEKNFRSVLNRVGHVGLVGHSRGSFSWVVLVGHSCGSNSWVILVAHSGGSNSWVKHVGHSCWSFLVIHYHWSFLCLELLGTPRSQNCPTILVRLWILVTFSKIFNIYNLPYGFLFFLYSNIFLLSSWILEFYPP